MRRSTTCLPTCCLGTLRLPYERAGQIFEILFQETRHVGGYRNNPTESYGAGKTLQCGVQAGLSAGSECSEALRCRLHRCRLLPMSSRMQATDRGRVVRPPRRATVPLRNGGLVAAPQRQFVRRQERDRPVLQVSPGPFSPGGNRIAGGGEFQQLLSGI
jgi:hypothetical protein